MDSANQRKFIVQGRVPGDDDDTAAEVVINGDESPTDVFIESFLYRGNIPKDWKQRPPNTLENRYGEWAYVHSVIELPNKELDTLLSITLAQLVLIPPHNPDRFETVDGLKNPNYTNGMRVGFAMKALRSFQNACHMKEEVDVAASDLICDLLHLVHASDHLPLAILDSAINSFLSESGGNHS